MKKTTSLFLILCTYFCFSQNTGSGTITITTSDGLPHPIAIYASHLDVNPNAFRYVYGNTNEPIPFGPWYVEETLSTDDTTISKNVVLFKNPSSNLFVSINNSTKHISCEVFDINGKLVSTPKIKFNGDYTNIQDDLNSVANGLYFVRISGGINQTIKFIKDDSPFYQTKTVHKNKYSNARISANNNPSQENYRFIWNSNDVVDEEVLVQILPGTGNNIVLSGELAYVGPESGDIFINPLLNGSPVFNATVTMTNTITPDSTYSLPTPLSRAAFWNIYVSDTDNPTNYQVDIVSNEADPNFLPTTTFLDIYQDDNAEINGLQNVELTPIPDQVEVTVAVRNYDDVSIMEENTLVKVFDDSDDSLIAQQTTPSTGMVTFTIPSNTSIYTKISKTNYYTKTNKPIQIESPSVVSEMKDTINVISIPYKTMNNGNHLPAAVVRDVLVDGKVNWPMLKGEGLMYVIPSPNLEVMKTEIQSMIVACGLPEITFSDTPVDIPGGTQAVNFNVFTSPIDFGVNMTGLVGTATTTIGSHGQANGHSVTLSASQWNVGGSPSDWQDLQHELARLLGYETDGTYPSVVTVTANIEFWESLENLASFPLLSGIGRYSYIEKDANGNYLETMYVFDIEE